MRDSQVLKAATFLAAIVMTMSTLATHADVGARPTTGTVTNLDEQSTIGYNCRKINDASIECKFHSVDLSPGLTQEEADDLRVSGVQEIFTEETPENCKKMLSSDIRSELEAKRDEYPIVYKNMTEMLDRYQAFCDSRTERAARAYIEHVIGMQTRTCKVRVDSWKAIFGRANDATGLWVNQSGPDGPCRTMATQSFAPVTRGTFEFFEYVRTRSI